MNQNTKQKRSAASWLAELAKGRYGEYALSVLTALLGVACSLAPYFIIIRIITALISGTAELSYCLTLCAWMAGCWVLRYVLHSVSTSLSHHATFHVLANTRTRLLDKLATLPLGTVLDHSSGSYKNIIVERVDSIETTLAHLLPEMTANIVGALAVLVLLFVYLYKQLRRVYRIKEELSQTNAKLARLNEELGEKNEQLSDSNAVKVQYIARFFDLCSMYIDKMDDYRKSLKKLAQDRKFDELNRRLKSTSMLEDEQDELYKNFDAIFLNLYPSFVEDFNALLTEDERIVLKQEDLLNKELRIYALLRLGITDSVKIASFLRCSLSTVYNYRTKVRNKAAISREEFEKMVMKIGTAHKTDV